MSFKCTKCGRNAKFTCKCCNKPFCGYHLSQKSKINPLYYTDLRDIVSSAIAKKIADYTVPAGLCKDCVIKEVIKKGVDFSIKPGNVINDFLNSLFKK